MSDVAFNVTGYPEVQRALKRFDAEAHKELNRVIRFEVRAVAVVAKGNASWSKTIPASITTTVTRRGAGVKTRRKVAPVGALYERGSGRGGSWRHPLFGNTNFWFSQSARPFIQPAVNASEPHIKAKLGPLLSQAAREVGL